MHCTCCVAPYDHAFSLCVRGQFTKQYRPYKAWLAEDITPPSSLSVGAYSVFNLDWCMNVITVIDTQYWCWSRPDSVCLRYVS